MNKLLMMCVLSLSASAAAASTLNVATGSGTGTYTKIFKDMGQVCPESSYLLERKTGGSLDNIELLLGNSVSLAFVQSDVLIAKQKIDKDIRVNEIKTLLPLYNEEIHVIALKGSGLSTFADLAPKKGRIGNLGAKSYNVVTFGGSVITANVLKAYTGINYGIITVKDSDAAVAALKAKKADAIIAVVGAPAEWVSRLDNSFTILPIPASVGAKLNGLYDTGSISYSNFGLGAVPTFSVKSILATRDFKTPEKKAQLLSYQKCVRSKITQLRETEGFQSKWQFVDFSKSSWPIYK